MMALGLVTAFFSIVVANRDSDQGPSMTTVFADGFETDLGAWTIEDESGSENGIYYWAQTTNAASEGVASVWATGGGDGSSLTPGSSDYPNNVLSSMAAGPFDVGEATGLYLSFDYWLKTQPELDGLIVQASTDGASFTTIGSLYSGDSQGWQSDTVDLSEYAGESQLWFKFVFSSNPTVTDLGVFLDNVMLEQYAETLVYLPSIRRDPTPTPTPTPTPLPFYYRDDFNDPNSGWPTPDNRDVSNDCFRWFYADGFYRNEICDDRTDVKVSPLVRLPDGGYDMRVSGRFALDGGWWTSYGVLFDAKDDPNPSNPDLGDYYMIWVLWEGNDRHLWKILKDVPGDQFDVTNWTPLDPSQYNYGNNGTAFNEWRVVRTDSTITVYVNDHLLATVNEDRPTTNNQYLFGLFASTYETNRLEAGFDYVQIEELGGPSAPQMARPLGTGGTYVSEPFDLEHLLPSQDK